MSDLKIQYEIVELDSVIDYFVRGYSKAGGEIEHHEYFVDSAKGKVAIRLYVREPVNDHEHSPKVSDR